MVLRGAIAFFSSIVLLSFSALAEKRVALVIGNGAYAKVPKLDNPKNDAAAIEAMFKAAGFDVVVRANDVGVAAMRRALRDFSDTANDADVAVVFYAGHGLEVSGANYLIPTDAVLERDIDVQDEAVPLDRVSQMLERVKYLRLIILDACRDNPFVRSMRRTITTRTVRSGYGEIDEKSLPPNTLIAYAQRAGATAEDGAGSNSPYTTALIKHLPTPGLDIELALRRVRDDVLKSTRNRQEPFKYGSLGGTEVALVAAKPPPSAPGPMTSPMSEAERAWADAKDTTSITVLEDFVTRYKNSFHETLARARLEELKQAQAKAELEAQAKSKLEADARARAEADRQRVAMLRKQEEDRKAAEASSLPPGVKRGGTLKFAVVAEPPNYDCHGSTTFALVHPIAPHYSLLVKFDGKEYPKVVGDLAQSWSVAPDGMSYTFTLKSGVKFHDGTPLTSADVKASYDRIINPPEGVVSIRKAYYTDLVAETPDSSTVVFKLKAPMAGVLEALASPFNCIYSAAKLKQNPRYPEAEIIGSGPFTFVAHVKGTSWEGKRFAGYFDSGKPYLDGYKAFFIKSNGVVPGILGGQFDAEFRSRNPSEKAQLLDKMSGNLTVFEGPWVSNLMIVFNTTRKPFDDVRVRRALTMAFDRWGGSEALSKISILKYVGGIMRPGYFMALPQAELVNLPGFSKNINKSREEAKKLLEQAGVKDFKFKLLNRNVAEPYTPGAVYAIDQWRRVGVVAEHEQLETKLYQDRVAAGDFDVAIEFQADYMDDPTAQFSKFLSKKLSPSGYSGHNDAKIDEMYERQRRTLDVAERTRIVHEMERYALVQAYNVPLLWWQRIIVNNKKIRGWEMTPSHYISQDLANVWLDQ
jgi:peptide/nickel transport system substrate-binding protein